MSKVEAEWIADLFDEIVVSIDGPHSINDKLRVFKNQTGSTDIAVASANIFSKGARIGIHSVVTPLSIGKAIEIIDFFKNNIPNIDFINFQRCRQTQEGRNEILALDIREYMDFIKTALEYAPDIVRTSLTDITLKRAFCKGCSGNMIYCFPNGNITLCNEHDDDIYVIGTYKEKPKIEQLLYLNYKDSLARKIGGLRCEECFVFPFCRGGCHSYYLQCDNYSTEWCGAFRENVKRVLKSRMNTAEIQYEYFNGKHLKYFHY
jgi:radical SAM protein with 4Fe4S-binding SPASM domain